MNLDQYVEEAKKTTPKTLGTHYDKLDALHYLLGLGTEVGEITDAYKRNLAYGVELDITNLKEELGDVLWYLVNLCSELDIDIEEVFSMNIAKLKLRYGKSFSNSRAINRDTQAERAVLEGEEKHAN